jgi:hypothetical protein
MGLIRPVQPISLIRPINRLTLLISIIPIPILEPHTGHALPQTAFLDEILFQSANLLIEQIVGLVDQTEGDVGDDFGGAGFA